MPLQYYIAAAFIALWAVLMLRLLPRALHLQRSAHERRHPKTKGARSVQHHGFRPHFLPH